MSEIASDLTPSVEIDIRRAAPPGPAPAVSVVIPAYNRAGTLPAAIASVLGQTWQDLELIIVDDGSSDDTVEIACATEDPRIRVVQHKTNGGPSVARNTGTQIARAPLVAFQDSDDIWLADKLAAQTATFDDPAVLASYCGMIITGTPGAAGVQGPISQVPEGRYPTGTITADLLAGSFISTQTLMARRAALLEAGLFDTSLRALEDWDIALTLSQAGLIAAVPAPLVVQRFSDNSLTAQSKSWAYGHRAVVEKHAQLFAAHPKLAAVQWQRIAGRMHRIGDRTAEHAAIRHAIEHDPWNMRSYLQMMRTVLKRGSR